MSGDVKLIPKLPGPRGYQAPDPVLLTNNKIGSELETRKGYPLPEISEGGSCPHLPDFRCGCSPAGIQGTHKKKPFKHQCLKGCTQLTWPIPVTIFLSVTPRNETSSYTGLVMISFRQVFWLPSLFSGLPILFLLKQWHYLLKRLFI